jgi:phosphoglycolate phosphatase
MNAVLSTRPRAVLFDWDNTLVDTWDTIHDAMNTTLTAMGHATWTFDETRQRVRKALREAFPELFGDAWEQARDIFYARFQEIHLETLAEKPGSGDLIRELAEKGIFLGVVSNKSGDHLRRETAYLGWDRYFTSVVGATDAKRDKPAIDPILLALQGSGVAPGSDVWFIGDTAIDMQCALDANCMAILVRETPPEREEFGKFFPQTHFIDCIELRALVRTL